MGEKFFHLWPQGRICAAVFNHNDTSHRKLITIGNYFKTKESAEHHRDRLGVIQELRVLAKGFVPDWSDAEQGKYSLFYDHKIQHWKVTRGSYAQSPLDVVFGTSEDAHAACVTLGARLDVLLKQEGE